MSQDLSTDISPEIINSLILTGDMSQLKPSDQTKYYNAICQLIGISPLTQPFAIIVYQGKKTLYARKDCAQQLCNTRKISTEITKTDKDELVYTTHVRASMPDGRKTDDIGCVGISGVKGQDLANLYMKSATKAKRRAVLALCGLGMPDETEVEDFSNPNQTHQNNTKSRVESIIETTLEEVKDDKSNIKTESKKENVKETTESNDKINKTDDYKRNANPTNTIRESIQQSLPKGHKTTQGIITEPAKYAEIGDNKTPKWVFTMGELKLGTFEKAVFEGLSDILDLQKETPILLEIEYKERETSAGKFVKDIINFKQVTGNKVPI